MRDLFTITSRNRSDYFTWEVICRTAIFDYIVKLKVAVNKM